MQGRKTFWTMVLAVAAIGLLSLGALAEEVPQLAWRGAVIRVTQGTKVGDFKDGLLHKRPILWDYDLVDPRDFGPAAVKTLEAKGYKVSEGDGVLFDDGAAKARYQIGAVINGIVFNVEAIPLLPTKSTVSLDVEWQVFDALQNKVVLKYTATGEEKKSEINPRVFVGAFTASLEKFISAPEFTTLMAGGVKPEESATKWDSAVEVRLCKDAKPIQLPADIEKVFGSVVTLRVGSTIASGVIISEDGYVLTADHVVSGVKDVQVSFKGGLSLPAQVLRNDGFQDIALLKLPGSGYSALPLALDAAPTVGSDVFAVGTPASEQLALSLSKGIVSGARVLDGFAYVQTDASLSPGYSGGPLLDQKGQVVGIISWKVAAPGFEGLSFGVPIPAIAKRLGITWK